MVSMALIALSLYSITKANVKPRKIFEIHIKLEMPRLSAVQREQAIGMLMGGISQPAVARHFNVAKSTVLRLVRRLEETGSTRDRPRPGQPRVMHPKPGSQNSLNSFARSFSKCCSDSGDNTGSP